MAESFKFVYAIVLFIFLFLVAIEAGGGRVECETQEDCPQSPNIFYVIKCIHYFCEWVVEDFDLIP
ncbi:unnamed protein product [Lathyrus oleraceus]